MENTNAVLIGTLTATIDGDGRYTDRLEVKLNVTTNTVTVQVRSSTPRGGMDGDSTPYWNDQLVATLTNPKPADVLKAVKSALSNDAWNFKRYGKPTKNFLWYTPEAHRVGLSLALVKSALLG